MHARGLAVAITRTALVLAIVALSAAGVAPLAEAKVAPGSEVVLDVGLFEGAVTPASPGEEAPVVVKLACELARNATRGGASVLLTVKGAPEWASVRLDPPAVQPRASQCGRDGYVSNTVTMRATVTAQAPAMQFAKFVIEARTENLTAGAYLERAEGLVQAGYLGRLDLTTTAVVQSTRLPGQLIFPFKVVNLGNGATKVTFEAGPVPAGWGALPPTPTIVPPAQDGEGPNAVDLRFTVLTPGETDVKNATITLTATSHFAGDATREGETRTLTFYANIQSTLLPAPGLALGLAGVAGAAFALARARRAR